MRNFVRAMLVAMIVSSLAFAAYSQTDERPNPFDAGMSPERLEHLTEEMERYIAEERLPSAVVLIIRYGQLAYLDAFGWQDIESQTPMREDSLVRIFSMTKPITSVAALILFEENRFLLTDPVSRYLPEFENVKVFVEERDGELILEDPIEPITIQQLFMHTSGYPYNVPASVSHLLSEMYQDADILSYDKTLAEAMRELSQLPLLHQPGSAWEYGLSTDILGRLVEAVSGQALGDFMRERIFEPLDMRDTAYLVAEEDWPRVARVYSPGEEGGLEPADPDGWIFEADSHEAARLQAGGHGLISSARDYGRFAQMLLNGGQLDGARILSRKTVELMTTDLLRDETVMTSWFNHRYSGFGLGVRVVKDKAFGSSVASLGTYGWDGYANTHFFVDPQEELIGVFLSQHIPPNQPEQIWERFANLVYQAIDD